MSNTEKLIEPGEADSVKTDLEETLQACLQFNKRGGLLPVVVQELATKQVLMLGYTNKEAYEHTLQTSKATFWSTSRNQLWVKGLTSGNTLFVNQILVDCDQDALVYLVSLEGRGVCHTFDQHGNERKACFYRTVETDKIRLAFLPGTQ